MCMKLTKFEKVLLTVSTISAVISTVKLITTLINKASKETDEVLYVEDDAGNYVYQDLGYSTSFSIS